MSETTTDRDQQLVDELVRMIDEWELQNADGWASANEQEIAMRALAVEMLELMRPKLEQLPEIGRILTTLGAQ